MKVFFTSGLRFDSASSRRVEVERQVFMSWVEKLSTNEAEIYYRTGLILGTINGEILCT